MYDATRWTPGELVAQCKYGENAWQQPAALHSAGSDDPLALERFALVQGDAPSYNNYCDLNRMLQTMTHMAAVQASNEIRHVPHLAVGVKHGNPCGAAMGRTCEDAIRNMVGGDKRAIFGGLVMTNFRLTESLAHLLVMHGMPGDQRRMLDGVVVPGIADFAVDMLQRKKDKCRLLVNPALEYMRLDSTPIRRAVRGGYLEQRNYTFVPLFHCLQGDVDELKPTQLMGLALAWAVGSTSNSNTITLVKDGMLIGNAVGQQDRVSACELAIKRARDAGHATERSVAYSDSFFPFRDGPDTLVAAGVEAVLASTGSLKDQEVMAVFKDGGVKFVHGPDAQIRGFFGH